MRCAGTIGRDAMRRFAEGIPERDSPSNASPEAMALPEACGPTLLGLVLSSIWRNSGMSLQFLDFCPSQTIRGLWLLAYSGKRVLRQEAFNSRAACSSSGDQSARPRSRVAPRVRDHGSVGFA
jgi:hypothetical protein